MIEPGKLLDSFCGSPLYAAPEILLAERYQIHYISCPWPKTPFISTQSLA
jgi:hypothetical protein